MKKAVKKTPFEETKISKAQIEFYKDVIQLLLKAKIPFMVGGTHAINFYTGINRWTKDFDLFCKPDDCPVILNMLAEKGYKIRMIDTRWLGKAYKDTFKIDFIFDTSAGLTPVDDSWFEYIKETELFGYKVKVVPAEELIWNRIFIQTRDRYDGPDINHIFLKYGKSLDWKRLLMRMGKYWELLFAHIINFRFVYPSERNIVPEWLLNELLSRLNSQIKNPIPEIKVSNGRLLSMIHYEIDIKEWGFKDIT